MGNLLYSILLVEDDKEIIKNLTEFLNNEGFVVNSVTGQKDALLYVDEHMQDVDIVLLDVSLEDGNGFAVCTAIKQNTDIPVIFLTASGDEYSVVMGLDMGADDYIGKPFSTSLLKGKINNILKARERFRQYYSSTINIDTAKMTSNAMDNEFLSKVIQIIEDNISDEKFSTEDLANKLFMSRSNLYIKMNAISGEAPANFIRRIRFNKGCQMLLEGRYTVAEISNKIGFSSPSYFTNSFKKYIGMLPTEYIKKHQEKSNS